MSTNVTALIVLGSTRIKQRQFAFLVAQSLQYSLTELGVPSSIVAEEEGGEATWVFGLWDPLNLTRFDCEAFIHISSEQLPYYVDAPQAILDRWYRIKESLNNYDFIFEYSIPQVKFLKGYANPDRDPNSIIHFPWGYSPKMDYARYGVKQYGPVSTALRRVHFLGGVTPRRREILQALAEKFVINKDASYTYPGRLVKKAAISLNLRKDDRGSFAAGRVASLLLGNQAFTITEPFEQEEKLPFIDGKHLVVASNVEDMKEKIGYYLEHQEERLKIAEQGYCFVTEHYTMTQNLCKALRRAKLMRGKRFVREK